MIFFKLKDQKCLFQFWFFLFTFYFKWNQSRCTEIDFNFQLSLMDGNRMDERYTHLKGTEESTSRVDSSVPLMHHDPRYLGLICLVKKRKICFQILSDLRIQSWIFTHPYLHCIPANSPGFSGSLQVFHEISRSPGLSTKSPGNYLPWLFLHFLFINFLGNVLLLHRKKWKPKKEKKGPLIKMATTLKIFGVVSRFLYSGGWQVCHWVLMI